MEEVEKEFEKREAVIREIIRLLDEQRAES